jgi:putative transcriptional regulator
MPIIVRIDVELARRKMSVGEFAERIGLTPANVAVLKNGRAKAVRFSTLEAMCRVLDCQPGDLLEWIDDESPDGVDAGERADQSDAAQIHGGQTDAVQTYGGEITPTPLPGSARAHRRSAESGSGSAPASRAGGST